MNVQDVYIRGLANVKALKVAPTKPTPGWIRKIGTSLLILGSGLSSMAALIGIKELAIIAGFAGIIGKLITNLFGE